MNLSFKSHFPWTGADGKPEPTYFDGRILSALNPKPESPAPPLRKLHTIRRAAADGTCRYREGMDLHMVTGPRFKPERFAVAKCTGVQDIIMKLDRLAKIDGALVLDVRVAGKVVPYGIIQHGPFTGHIIHWTDLRY